MKKRRKPKPDYVSAGHAVISRGYIVAIINSRKGRRNGKTVTVFKWSDYVERIADGTPWFGVNEYRPRLLRAATALEIQRYKHSQALREVREKLRIQSAPFEYVSDAAYRKATV